MDRQIDFSLLNGLFPSSAYVQMWSKNLVAQYAALSTSMSSSASNAIGFLQSQGVIVDEPAAVENFLTNYYGIVAYLFDAPKKVAGYFGSAKMTLGLLHDPEIMDEEPELYFEVETGLKAKEANERLSRINREWLLISKDPDLMSLNITLKFA